MLEITLVLEWVFLDDVKSYNTNKDSLLYKDTLNISVNYNKSIGVGKPYIHYIAVKVMNNVSRKSVDWHPYKTAGIPGLPYNDMFIMDVDI
jgi:hypothetical protein